MIVDLSDYDDVYVVVDKVKNSQKLSATLSSKSKGDDPCRLDLDVAVETSTFVPGEPVDALDHDLFKVHVPENFNVGDSMSAIRKFLGGLRDLGTVVDFGSGTNRRYCDLVNIIEHVEWREMRTMCTCGCGVVPYVTPFYMHKILKTFLAVNSLQNNSFSLVQKLLNQVLVYELDFVIIQPKHLNPDEFDVSHLILTRFPGVVVHHLDGGRMTAYEYRQDDVIARRQATLSKTNEICISVDGMPLDREDTGKKQSVLIFGITKDKDLLVVEAKNKGHLDFLVAGHITYGETPIQSAIREWREEMISDVPFMDYYGYIDPTIGMAKAYVFVTFVDDVKCIPERGQVRKLRTDDFCRNDFYPAVRALNCYFGFSAKFDLDCFTKKHYDKQAAMDYKERFMKRYSSMPKYQRIKDDSGIPAMWKVIFRDFKKQFHSQCRVGAEDLKNKFYLDMRTTNQTARIYSKVSLGEIVMLQTDTYTPCPIVKIEYQGREVGFLVYIRTCANLNKRLYRVQELNCVLPITFPGNLLVNYPIDRFAHIRDLFSAGVPLSVSQKSFIECATEATIDTYKFLKRYDIEMTDTECGANVLSQFKGCSYDEAVFMIRKIGYFGVDSKYVD